LLNERWLSSLFAMKVIAGCDRKYWTRSIFHAFFGTAKVSGAFYATTDGKEGRGGLLVASAYAMKTIAACARIDWTRG
jgi:hypothetical protein